MKIRAWFATAVIWMVPVSAISGTAGQDNPQKYDAPVSGKPLVVIGASYAKDWDIRTVGGYRIVNKGTGGEETHQMLARFDRDVVSQKPAAVLVWGFINDIFRSPRDAITTRKEQARANLAEMTRRAKAAGIRTILATEVPITTADRLTDRLLGWLGALRGKQSYQDYVNGHVRDINAWIRDFGRSEKLTVLDFEAVLAGETGVRQQKYATEDGSHLSREAYTALTDYAVAAFAKGSR